MTTTLSPVYEARVRAYGHEYPATAWAVTGRTARVRFTTAGGRTYEKTYPRVTTAEGLKAYGEGLVWVSDLACTVPVAPARKLAPRPRWEGACGCGYTTPWTFGVRKHAVDDLTRHRETCHFGSYEIRVATRGG